MIGQWFGVFEYCVDHPDAEHETASGDDLPGTLPDLSDPATLGCLLALVRGAWGDPGAFVAPHNASGDIARWSVIVIGIAASTADSEAGALVAALEAAP